MLILLRPPPHTEAISVSGSHGSRRYAVSDDGLIHDVAAGDLVQLLAAGCEPTGPIPPKQEPPRVRLRTPKPHGVYQPRTGWRYHADAEGIMSVHPDDVAALLRAGCIRL